MNTQAVLPLEGNRPTFSNPEVLADHSPDLSRRWSITVRWGPEDARLLPWLLLNPSTAGLGLSRDNLDPTLRRVRGFTVNAGFRGFLLLNLYSLVSTDPAGLAAEDPDDLRHEGPALDLLAGLDRVVCAWGAHPMAEARARRLLGMTSARLQCLGTTTQGWPRHPLYLSGGRRPVPWAWPDSVLR